MILKTGESYGRARLWGETSLKQGFLVTFQSTPEQLPVIIDAQKWARP